MLIRCWLASLLLFLFVGCAPATGVYHTVQKGQTLYQIAKTYQVDPVRLARINRISDPTRLSIGDRLYIPEATGLKHVTPTVVVGQNPKPAPTAPSSRPIMPPAPKPTVVSKPAPKISVPSAKPVLKPVITHGKPAGAAKGRFLWPVSGKVIKSFGSKTKSATGNGIEIATRVQSRVKSAAAGKVIYSGNGIPGYGNLIIIQHDDSLYSVYGFNQKNLVSAGSFVSQGDAIALSGVPPSGGVPRLYFEARYGKSPVDPFFYLP